MLLFLTEYLMRYESGFRVFRYLTLRTILGVLTALAIALLIGPFMIGACLTIRWPRASATTGRRPTSPRPARPPWAGS